MRRPLLALSLFAACMLAHGQDAGTTCHARWPIDPEAPGAPQGAALERALLKRFPNELAFHDARERALSIRAARIDRDRATLKLLAAQREALQPDALRPAGDPLPPKLARSLETNRAALDAGQAALAVANCRLAAEQAAYDRALARVRGAWK